jgi:hypothetical protein
MLEQEYISARMCLYNFSLSLSLTHTHLHPHPHTPTPTHLCNTLDPLDASTLDVIDYVINSAT